jgi:hypothetical protein
MGQMHLNVVRLLEVTPCKNCLTISNIKVVEPNVLEADLTLKHPFPGLLKYTGFDVRGIFISEANYTFPASGRKIAWGTDLPIVLNPDGYTQLFNPTEYPPTTPAALGYIPGKYATGGDLTATLNPFLAYRRDAPRCMFEAGGSETRTVRLYVPPGPIHFGYAVDACWQLVENVIDPLTDFPPDANCLEAYRVSVDIPYDDDSSWMCQNPINVEVFDHQGLETISTVTIEASNLFSGEVALTYSVQTGEDSWLFSGMIMNENGVSDLAYPLLVRVVDTKLDQNLDQVDAWQVLTANISEPPSHEGWTFACCMWENCVSPGNPGWTTNPPFGPSGPGSIRWPTAGTGNYGGSLGTVVSAPFEVPTGASEVNLRVYMAEFFGGSWPYYHNSNWKIVESSTPGIAPFQISGGLPGGGAFLQNSLAHGSTGWGQYLDDPSYYGPMSDQPGWNGPHGGAFGSDFPGSLAMYMDLIIPASFYGKTVKVCWQMQPDECGFVGVAGFAMDDVELKVY